MRAPLFKPVSPILPLLAWSTPAVTDAFVFFLSAFLEFAAATLVTGTTNATANVYVYCFVVMNVDVLVTSQLSVHPAPIYAM